MAPQRRVFAAAILIVASAAARGQASLIPWSYQWNAHPIVINVNSLGPHQPAPGGITLIPGAITVTGASPGVALGSSYIVAANLATFNFALNPDGALYRFTNSPYNLSVTLTDIDSKVSKSLTFSAVFNGTMTASSANIRTRSTSPIRRFAMLGRNIYTVTIASYTPPGPPSATNEGTIGAFVNVHPASAPEPSGLTLAWMGLAGTLGFGVRRLAVTGSPRSGRRHQLLPPRKMRFVFSPFSE
jgi:hypothetical protein